MKSFKNKVYTVSYLGQPVYVGVTKDIVSRTKAHLVTMHKRLGIGTDKRHLISVEEIDSARTIAGANTLETYWIAQLGAWGFNLLNRHKISGSRKKWVPRKTMVSFNKQELFLIGGSISAEDSLLISEKYNLSRRKVYGRPGFRVDIKVYWAILAHFNIPFRDF